MPDVERFAPDPEPGRRLRPAGAVGLRDGRARRRGRRAGTRSCSATCRGWSSTTTPPTTPRGRRTGSTRSPPRRARWSRCSRSGWACRSTLADGALATALMAGIVMDTATFAHPNATPRTLAVSAALVEAGRAAVRHLAPPLPLQARRAAPAVRAGARPARARRPTGGVDLVDAATRRPRGHRRAAGALGGDHRPARPVRVRRGRDAAQGAGRRDDAPVVRTKPGGVDATVLTGAFGGGGHARAAGATIALPVDRGGRRGRRRGRAPRRGRPPVSAADAAAGSTASSSSPSRRARPRTTSSASCGACRRRAGSATAGRSTRSRPACCPCSSAGRRASSSTTSASTKRYRATICFGERSTTDDIDGERTPVDGPPVDPRGGRVAGLAAFTGPISQVPPDYSAVQIAGPARVPAGALGRARRARRRATW